MSSSVKRFELFRMLFAIALLVSFGIIFLVSSQPLTAIYTLITGPFKSRRNFANVIEAMIPLIFTGTGVCIMFSANQINLAGEGAFHIGGLVSAVVALELGLSAGLSQAVAILLSGLAGAIFTAVPAVLKIKTNSSVLVSSLMLNYLAQWFATFILMHFICDPSIGSGSYLIPEELKLPEGIVLRAWHCTIRPGDYLEKVTTGHSLMGRGYFILQEEEGLQDKNMAHGAKLIHAASMVLGQFGLE